MFIDCHVHCRDFEQSHKETVAHALKVAKDSGVSAIFDMPNTSPAVTTRDVVVERLALAREANSPVFYGLYIGLTSDPEQIREAVDLYREFSPKDSGASVGVIGLKMFAGKSVGDLTVSDADAQLVVYRELVKNGFFGVLVVHCEKESEMMPEMWEPSRPETHGDARPEEAELASVRDQINFALRAGYKGKLHIAHVSVPQAVDVINFHKGSLNISCGATPHHLLLNDDLMKSEEGILYKVNPPLRGKSAQWSLLEKFKEGKINLLETDHAPHTREEKFVGHMSGIPNLASWPVFTNLLKREGVGEALLDRVAFENANRIYGTRIEKLSFPVKSRVDEYVFNPYEKFGVKLEKVKIGDKEVMPFTIPSGIITTRVSALVKLAREVPELGILTTKSIGPESKPGNREPILSQHADGAFINAVGLTNPGAEKFAKELAEADFPDDKFLLGSIFGGNVEEFVSVAKILEEHVDGFELNLSCPHAKGYGMQLGQDPEIVREIVRAVVRVTDKPVFAKLTPNAGNIGEIAKAAVDAGAYGIVAINTVGPGCHMSHGSAVLTNKVGGLSGVGVAPIGVKCVREIRQAVGEGIPVLGMGGIRTSKEVEAYSDAGADMFGIGSALAGMTDKVLKDYFTAVVGDVRNGTDYASGFLQKVDMDYQKVKIVGVEGSGEFKVYKTDRVVDAKPGQFVFAWLPGVGEKPFSVMDDDPFTLGILERGKFTEEFGRLREGDGFYFRGPYGEETCVPEGSNVVLVGGGCGIAGVYLLAKKFAGKANVTTLLAARDKEHVSYLEEFEKCGRVEVVTEDGSLGMRGLVTDMLNSMRVEKGTYFFNCGPKGMIDAVFPLELEVSDKIFSSIDCMTRCGVGICGSCADEKGRRTCIEGPFMSE
jgi:dihydroorotate dehydrogenase (NAD+) catalytic subunit